MNDSFHSCRVHFVIFAVLTHPVFWLRGMLLKPGKKCSFFNSHRAGSLNQIPEHYTNAQAVRFTCSSGNISMATLQ